MASGVPVESPVRIDALERWLGEEVGARSPLQVDLLSGGRSNLTFTVTDAEGSAWVLRRPPTGGLQASAHDVLREFRILSAMHAAGIRVPRAIAASSDGAISDAPLFLMERVGGRVLSDVDSAAVLSAAERTKLSEQMVDALVAIHELDPDSIGLGDLKRPGGLIERQLRRWSRQIDGYESVTSPLIHTVGKTLSESVPESQRTSVVHGDYKLANLIVGDDGELRSILDWELTAVGDPLVDLGWLLASWAEPGQGATWIMPPATLSPGFPDRAWLAARFGERSGLDTSELDYYLAFAYWRWSCINEGILARFESGKMGKKRIDLDAVRAQINWQLEAADRLLREAA